MGDGSGCFGSVQFPEKLVDLFELLLKSLGRKGLDDVVVGTVLEGLGDVIALSFRADDDKGEALVLRSFAAGGEQLEAVHAWHVQVGKHHGEGLLGDGGSLEHFKRLLPVGGLLDIGVSQLRETPLQHDADHLIVIDDQNSYGFGAHSFGIFSFSSSNGWISAISGVSIGILAILF